MQQTQNVLGNGLSSLVPLGANYLSVRIQNALWKAHQTLSGRDLLDFSDYHDDELIALLELSKVLKEAQKTGFPHKLLMGKTLGMIFDKASTRTRVSFEVAILQLGGHALFLPGEATQLRRGEPVSDTGKVLSRYLDAIMIRTFHQETLRDLAKHATIPVINGLTNEHHPCQVLADALTIMEYKNQLRGTTVAYIGDGNNMAHSWLQLAPKLGMNIRIGAPLGYLPDQSIVEEAKKHAIRNHTEVLVTTDPFRAAKDADVIYTDVWTSMGDEAESEIRLQEFQSYQINDTLMDAAKSDAIFMHCLPAHRGEEVTSSVIDGEQSVVFDQAENRLHAQKAILAALLADGGSFGEDFV